MKKILCITILVLSVFVLAGCWDAVEIEDQFLVWGMSWDIPKKDPDKMLMTIAGPTTSEGAEPVEKVTVEGYSIQQATNNAQALSYRQMELGHIRALVVGVDFAKKLGIQKALDEMGRNPRITRETKLVILEGEGNKLWDVKNPGNPIPVDYLVSLIQTNSKQSQTMDINFREFFEYLSTPGMEPVACYGKISKDKKAININHLAVFKRDKMVGTISGAEVTAFLLLRGKADTGYITVGQMSNSEKGQSAVYNFRFIKRKMKCTLENGVPHIKIQLFLEGDIVEFTPKAPIVNNIVIMATQKRLEQAAEREMREVIKKCQTKYKSDIFGFGQCYHAYFPEFAKKHMWAEVFPKAVITPEVTVKIRRVGVER